MEILCDQIKGVCLEICCIGFRLVLMGLCHKLSHISLDPLGRKKKGTWLQWQGYSVTFSYCSKSVFVVGLRHFTHVRGNV
jgi:hypothetical protein